MDNKTPSTSPATSPRTNLRGLKEHWRNDLIAGFSVALVALPLALGIATAAGAPPISGLASAILAGILTTFLRGTQVAINGPGNSLIVIVAGAFAAFGGRPDAFTHVLGAVVVAGGLQVLFGALRLGKLGDLIPAAVIQGMLAAIGLIIVGKQAHVLFGGAASSGNPIEVFRELPTTVANMNPSATLIGVISLAILLLHPRIKAKLVHFVPAPLWVVLIALPLAHALGLHKALLVSIPANLLASLARPSFELIATPPFWMVVMTLALVGSIENIVSVKATDKLDVYRRRSNLDRDLIGMGLSTIASGFLGGLPILTVIARSSVNVNHGGRTGWSNFFQGTILLVFVLFLSPLIQMLPLAALAAILVYTGYKLAAIHVVQDTLRKGPDHFLIFSITLAATLMWGLLSGIFVGLLAELTIHLVILGQKPREIFSRIWQTRVETVHEEGGPYLLRVRGVANYLSIPRMRRALAAVSGCQELIVDFSAAVLVDNTFLEYCHEFGRGYKRDHSHCDFSVIGLEAHRALSDHPDALHAQDPTKSTPRLTPRQKRIEALARERGWSFDARRDWDPDHLGDFQFFLQHPIEYRDTVVQGSFELKRGPVPFTLSDVTFDEGALIPEVYHTTTLVLHLSDDVPKLIIEKEELLDRVFELAGYQDVDYKHFTHYSRRFVVKGPSEDEIEAFLQPKVLDFLEGEEVYHLESTGRELVVFKFMRLATASEIETMLGFSERFVQLLADELIETRPSVDAVHTRRRLAAGA